MQKVDNNGLELGRAGGGQDHNGAKIILTLKLAGFWEGFFQRNEVCLIKFSFK